jgi:hypothetical protein
MEALITIRNRLDSISVQRVQQVERTEAAIRQSQIVLAAAHQTLLTAQHRLGDRVFSIEFHEYPPRAIFEFRVLPVGRPLLRKPSSITALTAINTISARPHDAPHHSTPKRERSSPPQPSPLSPAEDQGRVA